MARKILVVDDNEKNARLVKRRLEAKGYEVSLAFDGIQGVKKTFAQMPDLIILDLLMPGMDGYQACRLIKSNEGTAHIPILMLTALAGKGDKYWGTKTGADDYLTKPFSHKELVARAEALLARSHVDREALSRYEEDGTAVDESEMISRVSKLLDRKLYEATIANDLAKTAKFIEDDASLAESILLLLGKVMDFEVAGLLVLHTQTLTVYGNNALAERFAARLLAELREQGLAVDPESLQLRVLHGEGGAPPEGRDHVARCEAVILETRGNTLGVIGIERASSGGFSEDERGILELISDQAALILDNARLYAEMRKSAITDGLTGAFNHRYFYTRLREEYARAKRHQSPLSCLLVDIDRFKSVNDTYGHQQGDAVLAELARMLKGSVRKENLVARYGGEEFALLLPETDEEGALALAERVREMIENHRFLGAQGLLTVSVGVATLNDDTTSEEDLVRRADEALYRAKADGRNCVRVAAQELA